MTRAEARELMAGDKLVVTCEEAGGGIGGHSIPIGSEVKFVEYDAGLIGEVLVKRNGRHAYLFPSEVERKEADRGEA